MPVFSQVAVYLTTLFTSCMMCHGELARLRPGAKNLTSFYLTMSAGGAAGGLFVAVLSPLLFPALWEYQIGLFLAAALTALVLFLDKQSWLREQKPWVMPAMVVAVTIIPGYLVHLKIMEMPSWFIYLYWPTLVLLSVLTLALALKGGPRWLYNQDFHWNQESVLGGLLLLGIALFWNINQEVGKDLRRERNFYGALKVYEETLPDGSQGVVGLMNGRIVHGTQMEDASQRHVPTTYYAISSGVGLVLRNHPARSLGPMRVGAIGLGVGTLASYSRPGDYYRFYEINPAVVRIARGEGKYFTYLTDAKGQVDVELGDARLSLEAEAARGEFGKYDVLVVDAFSGDSIPMHLLTEEAMAVYLKHLRGPDSVIAYHISNIAVDLEPVVAGLAEKFRLQGIYAADSEYRGVALRSEWVLVSKSGVAFHDAAILRATRPLLVDEKGKRKRNPVLWTDDYSNVITLMR